MKVSFVDLKKQYETIKNEIDHSIFKAINDGDFILGKELEAFEKEFDSYSESKFCAGPRGTPTGKVPLDHFVFFIHMKKWLFLLELGLIQIYSTNFLYFAIKSSDPLKNISAISNAPNTKTLSAPSASSNTSSSNPGTISISSGGGGFTVYQLTDTASPTTPLNFKADVTNAQVSLSWSNPKDSDFIRVKIIRKMDAQPTSHTDGILIYDGADQIFTDINLTNNQSYYYSIYAYDNIPNYSAPAQLKATPLSNITQTSIISDLSKTLLSKLSQLSQIIPISSVYQ